MLRHRAIVAVLAGPLFLWIVTLGSWPYLAAIAVILSLAAVEYTRLFRRGDIRPSAPVVVAAVVGLVVSRRLSGFEGAALSITVVLLLAMAWHLVDYERGAQRSGTDFALTAAGGLYLGWIGAYLVSLRDLPGGLWWVLLALPTIWLADTGAYFVGSAIGRRKLSPRLSPKKTWEGYLAGIAAGVLGGLGLAALYIRLNGSDPFGSGPLTGLVVGVVLGVLAPLGDLGISMMKRELQVKDTGTLLPGHGGALDRIDSWLWAGVLTYYTAGLLARL